MMPARPLVCIVGPTASGKSAVAEQVALRTSGELVSIDAMQVYRGMDIGTAKTPRACRLRPLHMVDVCDVDEGYSAERFQTEARAVIDGLLAQGILPILCGGTGLYLNAVIDEMAFPPGYRGDTRRERYEELARSEGAAFLHGELARRDPASAEAIHPNNVRRIIRALEMCDEGRSYAASLASLHERQVHYPARIFGLDMPRDLLYRRIDRRVDEMFDAGLVDEVEALCARGLTANTTAGQAIGYKEIIAALSGACTMDEARAAIKANTRRYAKRQLSWFRHDGRVTWIDMGVEDVRSAARIIVQEVAHGAL